MVFFKGVTNTQTQKKRMQTHTSTKGVYYKYRWGGGLGREAHDVVLGVWCVSLHFYSHCFFIGVTNTQSQKRERKHKKNTQREASTNTDEEEGQGGTWCWCLVEAETEHQTKSGGNSCLLHLLNISVAIVRCQTQKKYTTTQAIILLKLLLQKIIF